MNSQTTSCFNYGDIPLTSQRTPNCTTGSFGDFYLSYNPNSFVEHISQANKRSEHRMAINLDKDIFSLNETVVSVLGAVAIERLQQAVK